MDESGAVPPPLPRTGRPPAGFNQRLLAGAIIVAGLIAWGATVENNGGWSFLINHAGLIVAVGMAVRLAGLLFPQWKRVIRPVGVVLAIGLVIWWSRVDWVVERWTNEYGDRIMDTRRRFSREHLEQTIFLKSGGMAWGGFAGDDQRHGRWVFAPELLGDTHTKHWYWYGEEVSEGEWMLRNK